jgi:hypothetical protein
VRREWDVLRVAVITRAQQLYLRLAWYLFRIGLKLLTGVDDDLMQWRYPIQLETNVTSAHAKSIDIVSKQAVCTAKVPFMLV